MKRAFFLVSALFVLFQLGEKVTAASIKASSENTGSDQQNRIQYAENRINRLVDGLVDLLNHYFDAFQIVFHTTHQTVTEIIKSTANVPDDASETEKALIQTFETNFNEGHAQLMDAIDQYQGQGVLALASLTQNATETMNTLISNINAAKEASGSSSA